MLKNASQFRSSFHSRCLSQSLSLLLSHVYSFPPPPSLLRGFTTSTTKLLSYIYYFITSGNRHVLWLPVRSVWRPCVPQVQGHLQAIRIWWHDHNAAAALQLLGQPDPRARRVEVRGYPAMLANGVRVVCCVCDWFGYTCPILISHLYIT